VHMCRQAISFGRRTAGWLWLASSPGTHVSAHQAGRFDLCPMLDPVLCPIPVQFQSNSSPLPVQLQCPMFRVMSSPTPMSNVQSDVQSNVRGLSDRVPGRLSPTHMILLMPPFARLLIELRGPPPPMGISREFTLCTSPHGPTESHDLTLAHLGTTHFYRPCERGNWLPQDSPALDCNLSQASAQT
jgi:hypothetical protein